MDPGKKFILWSLVVIAALIPFPTKIANQTVVHFRSTRGEPVPALKASQSWEGFGGISAYGSLTKITDQNGLVTFPALSGYGSIASRIFGHLITFISVHASYGAHVRIDFSLDPPRKAVFDTPAFIQPFSASRRYLDNFGRDYFLQSEKERQWISIGGDFLHATNEITILLE